MAYTIQLPDASLEFARAHIDAFSDSDFFPKPADFDVLWTMWSDVKAQLTSFVISKETVQPSRTMAAPKQGSGYRIVHQLEPLNAIAYIALVHSIAHDVESARVAASKRVAFSYRIQPDAKSFFATGNGYDLFIEQCRELSEQHAYVLVTDIADFYNSIYLHRLQGSVEVIGGGRKPEADAVERFLSLLNQKASQGIPVGPAPSIIMAEATLIDVDQFIELEGLRHTRYVDDFRIFSNDEEALRVVEERLVVYLYEHHRLQLSPLKTRLLRSEQFVERYLDPPSSTERRELLGAARAVADYGDMLTDSDIAELAQKHLQPNDPSVDEQSLRTATWKNILDFFAAREELEKRTIRSSVFCRMLQLALSASRLDVGLARYALRRSSSLGEAEVIPLLLGNIEELAPVIPDAFLCLHRLTNQAVASRYLGAVRALPRLSLFRRSELARHWLYWYLTSQTEFIADAEISNLIWSSAPIEHQARAAMCTRNLAWVRKQKNQIQEMRSWDRRAVLVASSLLPSAERRAWLSAIATPAPSSSESVVAKWLQTLP